MAALIEAQALTKAFDARTVVDQLSLSVARGEVLGLLGPNGAGKSTTMKMLTGYLTPDDGAASIAGHDVAAAPLAAKAAFGYLPEGAPAYGEMTAGDFLTFCAQARGIDGNAFAPAFDKAVAAVQIEAVLGQRIETLSKGFARRVGLAQALIHDPDVLILDEPTDGLDPNQKHEVRQLILDMAPRKAIVISTHILEEVDALCSRAIIIDHGRIVADGTPAALRAKSPLHGRIVVRVADDHVGMVQLNLGQISGVEDVIVRPSPTAIGTAELALTTQDAAAMLPTVKTAAQQGGWPVADISIGHGRLDDVFRELTRGDRAAVVQSAAQVAA